MICMKDSDSTTWTGRFIRLTHDEICSVDVNNIWEDNPEGCILQVNLKYPEELHDSRYDYPLVPGKIGINESILSDYYWEIASKYNISFGEIK